MLTTAVGRHVDPRRHATQDFEVGVASLLHRAIATVRFSPRGLHDLRQRCDQRTIDQRDHQRDVSQPIIQRERFALLTQFGEYFFEAICFEGQRRFR